LRNRQRRRKKPDPRVWRNKATQPISIVGTSVNAYNTSNYTQTPVDKSPIQ
jgi:hypothetical protein